MLIKEFFDPDTFTLSYLVYDGATRDCLIIDPVLDFDPPSGKVEDRSLRPLVDFIKAHELKVHLILETHAHADHLSGSQVLKKIFPKARLGIGARIKLVQETFKKIFNLDKKFLTDGSQFDLLLQDHQEIEVGSLKVKVIPTPGHTPACLSYLIGDAVFTGDSVFMPDYGTGRCDFPQGSAKNLYQSIKEGLYTLPDQTRVFVGHDYKPGGRELLFQTTIGECKKSNIHLREDTTLAAYVEFREGRDKTLKAPRLLLPSLQVNISAGHMPAKEDNGTSYLKLPMSIGTTLAQP